MEGSAQGESSSSNSPLMVRRSSKRHGNPKAGFLGTQRIHDYKSRFPAFIIFASLNEALRTIFLP